MSKALVSVVVLTFNGKDYIEGCLDSVLNQTYPALEVIVVDNASKDGTPELIEKRFSSVILVKNDANLGYAAGNNVGIKIAHGSYIVLLNQDTVVHSNWIEELVKATEVDERIGACASKLLYMDEHSRINNTGILMYKDLSIISRGLNELDLGQYDCQQEVFGAYGAAAFYRKDVLDEVGLFDEDYFLIGEEIDIAWRIRFAGFKCMYVPMAVVYHARSTSTGLYSPLKLYYSERNRIWNAVKFLPLPMLITSSFFSFQRYMAMAFIALRNKGKKAEAARRHSKIRLVVTLVKAWVDAFSGLPRMLKKRHQIQQAKRVSNQEIKGWLKQYEATLKDVVEK